MINLMPKTWAEEDEASSSLIRLLCIAVKALNYNCWVDGDYLRVMIHEWKLADGHLFVLRGRQSRTVQELLNGLGEIVAELGYFSRWQMMVTSHSSWRELAISVDRDKLRNGKVIPIKGFYQYAEE